MLSSTTKDWEIFNRTKKEYEANRLRIRESKVSRHIIAVMNKVETVLSVLNEIASCTTEKASLAEVIGMSYLKKASAMKELIINLSPLQTLLREKSFFFNVKKRITERASCPTSTKPLPSIVCFNDSTLSWDRVNEILIDMDNSRTLTVPLDTAKLITLAEEIRSNIVIRLDELSIKINKVECQQILKTFPVLYMKSEQTNTELLINMEEFVYMPGALEYFLTADKERVSENNNTAPEVEKTIQSNELPNHTTKGQPSLVQLFPSIVNVASEFIKQHSFSAQNRRRSETSYSSGITIPQIRDHLLAKVPGLEQRGISLSTTRRLFEAPNKSRTNSVGYKSYVQARVGVKKNSYREHHEDAHYLFARNKYRRELASLEDDDINIISTDDMAKLKVGAPAVSRYHQLNRLCGVNDQPNLSDHDFPTPGYLLNTSGYMFLKSIIDEEIDEDHHSTYNTFQQPADDSLLLDAMELQHCPVDSVSTLPDAIVDQLEKHLNIKTTVDDLKDSLISEITNNRPEYKKFRLGTISSFSDFENNTELIITASAALFSNICFLIDRNQNKVRQFQGRRLLNRESPIFIYQTDDNFNSPVFKKQSHNVNIDKNVTYDNVGREHMKTPHSGPAQVFLRAQRFNPTTIVTHISDLFEMLTQPESDKPGLFLMSDGGPDFNPTSVVNILYLYRLFKLLNLDILAAFTYAARYSAFNCIEHLWSPPQR